MASNDTLNPLEVNAIRQMRQDPPPFGEARVRVRLLTCSDHFILPGGGSIELDPASAEWHPRAPIRRSWAEVEMYPSHLRQLRAEFTRHAPSPEEIEEARADLVRDMHEIAGVDPKSAHAIPRTATGEDIARILYSGSLSGTTRKHYKPSWTASFGEVTSGREWYPIEAIEVPSERVAAPSKKGA